MITWYRTREQVPEQVPEGKGYNQVLSIEEDGYAHLGTTPHPDSVKWCYIKQISAPMDIKEIVKQYLEKGEQCREQSAEHNEQGAFNFWDGFVSCAENILRELE